MAKRAWIPGTFLVLAIPLLIERVEPLGDVPYRWLTGFSHGELEELSYLDADGLAARTGLAEVPGGFDRDQSYRGRAAHAIASYLGTRRWGPEVTLACGYLKEYVPALLLRRDVDPGDIAANYAGVTYALREEGRLTHD